MFESGNRPWTLDWRHNIQPHTALEQRHRICIIIYCLHRNCIHTGWRNSTGPTHVVQNVFLLFLKHVFDRVEVFSLRVICQYYTTPCVDRLFHTNAFTNVFGRIGHYCVRSALQHNGIIMNNIIDKSSSTAVVPTHSHDMLCSRQLWHLQTYSALVIMKL